MEFCSEFGYNYGFNGSDQEDYSDEDEVTKQKVKRKIRKADTNIIAIKFDELVKASETFAGEPISCRKCGGILSTFSRENIDKFIWKCEYCFESNDLTGRLDDLSAIPKKGDVTYILEVAPKQTAVKGSNSKNETSNDNTYFTFCIDISGSMDAAIPVRNNLDAQLPQQNANKRRYTRMNGMSRLEGVKVACLETLKKLKEDTPQKRVSLVTFSDSVKYFGDCTNNQPLLTIGDHQRSTSSFLSKPRNSTINSTSSITSKIKNLFSISTNKSTRSSENENEVEQHPIENNSNNNPIFAPTEDLSKKDKIIEHAAKMNGDLAVIEATHQAIEQRIRFLRTEGSTALGPGLLFSVNFAAKQAGSSVILCTDGAANVGIGSISGNEGEAEKFYDEVADYAKTSGVTVNVISMEGTDCKLALLGRVAERSNGSLSIVNPANLGDEFKSILGNRVVAVSVTAKLIVNHKYLYIRDSKLEAEEGKAIEANDESAKEALNKLKNSVITRDIGNANIDTEITYEYGFRKLEDKVEKPDNVKVLPFQVQIVYTTNDGTKALRVYTKEQKFTRSREEAEKKLLSKDIIFAHGAQMMSNQVLSQNVCASKFRNQANENLLNRNQYESPQAYIQTSAMVKNYSKSKKVTEMRDDEAAQFYSQAKVSRSKLTK